MHAQEDQRAVKFQLLQTQKNMKHVEEFYGNHSSEYRQLLVQFGELWSQLNDSHPPETFIQS